MSDNQEVLKMIHNQQFWSAVGGISSLLVSAGVFFNSRFRPRKPDLVTQKLLNRKNLRLLKTKHETEVKRLELSYQYQLTKLNLEYELLQKQEKIFLAKRNLEVITTEQNSETSKNET